MSRALTLIVVSWLGLVVFALPAAAAATVDAAAQSSIDRCRLALPDAASNPSAPGGWLADRVGSVRLLCLYGSVAVAPPVVPDALAEPFDLVVVRSAGGPVQVWLLIAERLLGHVDAVVVDEACFSSCANYIIPLGRTVVALPNSLVVWHGGPTLAGLGDDASGGATMGELMAYYDLADRTERLYAHLGISPDILRDSGRGDPTRPLAGYAFSPATLARCYGFTNLADLWHAGDDAAVAALAHKRSKKLNLAAAPKTGCAASEP